MFEYGVKVANHFAHEYEQGPLITDDYDTAIMYLRWAVRDNYSGEREADLDGMTDEELLLAGKTNKPKVRLVRRVVGDWKMVPQPKRKEGGAE